VDVHKITSAGMSRWMAESVVLWDPASGVTSKSITVGVLDFGPAQDATVRSNASVNRVRNVVSGHAEMPFRLTGSHPW